MEPPVPTPPESVINVGLISLTRRDSLIIDLLPSNENRSSILHNLLACYKLNDPIENSSLKLISYRYSNETEILKFHDTQYVSELLKQRNWEDYRNDLSKSQSTILTKLNSYSSVSKNDKNNGGKVENAPSSDDQNGVNNVEDSQSSQIGILDKFGLVHDCPIFPYLPSYVELTAGTSLSAASWLIQQSTKDGNVQNVAINWTGGRHHAHRSKASGFCYVNDITLSILQLRTRFKRIMYLDLDLHHGDGVAASFRFSDQVLTVSLHFSDVGFFPGSGSKLGFSGLGKGKEYDLNIPLKKGFSDESMGWILDEVIYKKMKKFNPDILVLQCGGDGLCSDTSYKEWNLTIKGYGLSISRLVKKFGKSALLVGGGGYNNLETSKLWCFITGLLTKGEEECLAWNMLPDGIDEALIDFGEFEFWANDNPSNMVDRNSLEYLESIKEKFVN